MEARFKSASVDLAAAPDFRLGTLQVSPSTRQVVHAGGSLTLEPRVMQVLVALNDAAGRVVSRDALVERCWDGRIVGDNAINRVVSRLRHLAQQCGAFTIETIPRVGYRLAATGTTEAPPPLATPADTVPVQMPGTAQGPVDRRWLLAGGAAALALGGAALVRRWPGAAAESERRAAVLVAQARVLLDSGVMGAASQALIVLEEAVEMAPGSAEAWGALALALASHLWWTPADETGDVSARARNAAERALALEPDNADAAAALVIRKTWFGRWAAHERGLRDVLARHPGHVTSQAELAFFLCQAGRWADALPLFDALALDDRLPPHFHDLFGAALGARGRRMEAERVLTEAVAHWPGIAMLWSARFEYLLAAGRLDDASAMVTAKVRFRFPRPPIPMDLGLEVADALSAQGASGARARAAAGVIAARDTGAIWSPAAARMLVLLGEPEAALAVARAYLVGGVSPGGRVHPPPPPADRRRTEFLFLPFMAPLRALGGFAPLVEAIGLGAYWRETGSAPQMVA